MTPAPPQSEADFESLRSRGDAVLVITGDPPSRLRCHSTLLRLASPLLDDLLGLCDTPAGAELTVDGPESAWLDALAHMYAGFLPLQSRPAERSAPATGAASGAATPAGKRKAVGADAASVQTPSFSWSSVAAMMPLLHKYQLQALLDRILAWISMQEMSGEPSSPAYALYWLDLADTLHLDLLADICHEQLLQLPLSLSPQDPGYVRTWLRLADERGLTSLLARCIALLNTGSAEGAGTGLPPSLEPGSDNYVLDLLRLVHTTGHFEELQPCRKKCMRAIRKAAERGTLQGQGGGGGHGQGEGVRHTHTGAGLVRDLLHPAAPAPLALGSRGTAQRAAEGAAAPGGGQGSLSAASSSAASLAAAGALSAALDGALGGASDARLDGLCALAEGLITRSSQLDSMSQTMQGARDVYLCSNCGHGLAVFKSPAQRKLPSWLRLVSTHQHPQQTTLECPVCGNASCTALPHPGDTKVIFSQE